MPFIFTVVCLCSCNIGLETTSNASANQTESKETTLSLSETSISLKVNDWAIVRAIVNSKENLTIRWINEAGSAIEIEPKDEYVVVYGRSIGEGYVTAIAGNNASSCKVVVTEENNEEEQIDPYIQEHQKEISLWVGEESVEFYQAVTKEYTDSHSDFGYTVKVVATDIGTAAGQMLADNTACGDIVTIAHDNIGKLAQKILVKPLTEPSLLAQIEDDNPAGFKDVIRSTVGDTVDKYVIGSPYISQALFLIYNKDYVSEEQAKSFEGLKQAAMAARASLSKADVSGCTLTGTDGYNFSFTLLARNESDNSTTLKIYEGLDKMNTYCQGDDTVAVARWGQTAFADGTLTWPNGTGYATMMQTKSSLAVVGGAWHYNAVKSALGADKVGVTLIPEFTLTSDNVVGTTIAPNTKMRGGTFADCKCFVINAASDASKYAAEQQLIKFLSSKEVQNRSFKSAMNVPAYSGAMTYIESIKSEIDASAYALAKAQIEMVKYGIPQPFVTATLNRYYYQCGAPDIYKNLLILDGSYEDAPLRRVREVLYIMEYIWKFGNGTVGQMVIPEILPADPIKAY